jgi:hypothetical protein
LRVGEVEFGGLVVGRCHFGVVLVRGIVVIAESEIDDLELSCLGVDEDVERLDVSVHDALGVNIVESLNGRIGTSKSCLV